MRPSGRQTHEMRAVTIQRNVNRHAEGSVLISCGETRVLCLASVEDRVPHFLRNKGEGWVTAEYGMLPRSTGSRMRREASQGKQGGRTLEIQRLIGRSLRAVVDRAALGERTITVDCDVLQADGGTRTAAITGAYVALADACRWLRDKRLIDTDPMHGRDDEPTGRWTSDSTPTVPLVALLEWTCRHARCRQAAEPWCHRASYSLQWNGNVVMRACAQHYPGL